jgi:glucan phosphoethanolaminetransferase (alkaline phosphatase superfamily)
MRDRDDADSRRSLIEATRVSDGEDARWRVMLARLLLCLTMILYLGLSAFFLVKLPNLHATRSLLFAGVLLLLCAFGALGLSRVRAAAIVAIGIAAALSIAIVAGYVVTGGLSSIVRNGTWNWMKAFGYCLALMLYESPVVAFILVWPLRRHTESAQQ